MAGIQDPKDYYGILGVTREAPPEEIKKAYRQMALRFHPDRNPGDRQAEERFKRISEAYGVLMDPEKKRRYDLASQSPFGAGGRPDFAYTQEEIFRDIFNNPMANEVFSDLNREFARMGFRFDERFFNHLFFGGQGIFFVVGGPAGVRYSSAGQASGRARDEARDFSPLLENIVLPRPRTWTGRIFSWIFRKGIGFFLRRLFPAAAAPPPPGASDLDLVYPFPLSGEEMASGGSKEFSLGREGKGESLSVKIPAGVKNGTLLRLRGMGRSRGGRAGDLYLKVERT